jgi:twitching motility protein PilT
VSGLPDGRDGFAPLLVRLLRAMAERGASDLHLTEGGAPRIRVDGVLLELEQVRGEAMDHDRGSALIPSLLRHVGLNPDAIEAGGDFLLPLEGVGRFRGHAFREQGRWAVSIRRIPEVPPRFESLGLPPVIRTLVERTRGLVLVTGPTGSGKSTTLAALVDALNRTAALHIVTIEDPVEFIHPSGRSLVRHREVGRDVHALDQAMNDALRQDPDVLLVGELRSPATIRAALTLAETGHLVLGTLHTATAPEAVGRIVDGSGAQDRGEIRAQLAEVLEGVVTQRLVRARRRGQQSPGRVAVAEVLVATPAVRAVIREGRIHQLPSLLQSGRSYGMQTLTESLVQRVVRGDVALEDALGVAPDPVELRRALDGHGPKPG